MALASVFKRPFFIKLLNWEYWPFNVVYGPLYLYWFWLCLRARSVFFFNTSNPTIENGGFLMESKIKIYELIPKEFSPITLFFEKGTSPEIVINKVSASRIAFPMIAKPDIGLRGIGVKKIDNAQQLEEYAQNTKANFLVQEYIPYENEIGLFYYRLPNEAQGHITSITGKEFLTVVGDGKSTVRELLNKNDRFLLQIPALEKNHPGLLDTILPNGEKQKLVPYGNHCRGTKFLDESHRINPFLVSSIDHVCHQIKGFYYGRMDIRFKSWEDLKIGKNFVIIELNGAGSEPGHIYDPQHSIFYGWSQITKHWRILLEISIQNHKALKIPYMTFAEGMDMLKKNTAYIKTIS